MKKPFALFAADKAPSLSKVHELIRELKVSQVMTKTLYTLPPDATMQEVKDLMRQHRISGVPVVDAQGLCGIVSLEDLIHALEQQALSAPIRQFMTPMPLVVARAQEPLLEAFKRLEQHNVGRMPVLDGHGALVGIVTHTDIIASLLKSLQDVYTEDERLCDCNPQYFFDALRSDATNLLLRYHVEAGDFAHGGEASARIKRALLRIGASPRLARRVAIAAYEAEINLIIHTNRGGSVLVDVTPQEIRVVVQDSGPGIPDVEEARRPGFSTASPRAREMGFGAGMGLTNIERCSDRLDIWSALGVGTRLEIVFKLPA